MEIKEAQGTDGILTHPFTQHDVETASHQVNVDRLKHLVGQDPKLEEPERNQVLDFLNNPNLLSTLLAGTAGAALATAIARYEKLDRTSQALLGLAGFGIGAILIEHIGQDQSHLVDYKAGRGFKVHT